LRKTCEENSLKSEVEVAARGAPNKPQLHYFPKMTNFYYDDKIVDLMDHHGPFGVVVYDIILTIVYNEGYYAEVSKDRLSRMVAKIIGNRWVKDKKAVVQVIDYCADIGLLDHDLLSQSIITSGGIQRRYYQIAVVLMKRRLYSKKYWLLENEEPVLSAPQTRKSSEENAVDSELNGINSEEKPFNSAKRKRKERKEEPAPPDPMAGGGEEQDDGGDNWLDYVD